MENIPYEVLKSSNPSIRFLDSAKMALCDPSPRGASKSNYHLQQ